MALTLTIGGTDFMPQYQTGSAQIQERLGNRANTLNLTIVKKPSDSAPSEGEEIVFKDGSRFLFGGFISRTDPRETGKGQLIAYRVEATDYTYVLLNKNAQKSYEDQTLKQIVDDLVSTYIDSGYSITTNNVETGPTINTVAFDHIPLRKALEKLAKITGFVWWIDYEKDIHFVNQEADAAPEAIRDDTDNFTNVRITRDTSQVRNSIVVRGGREEISSDFSQTFEADGVAREWILREKPKTMQKIELDTGGGFVEQTVGVDPIDDDSGNDFMFNYQEKYVRAADGTTTPSAGDKIKVTYRYEVPVIVQVKGASSINAMKALEGGDGIHDHTITDSSIESKEQAREIALKEIDEHGNPKVKGTLDTHTSLLQSGSVFRAGQTLTVNLPDWGISSDTQYLIQEVAITPIETDSTTEYNYSITFGGRLLGVREFLETVAGEEKVILDREEIDRIESFAETVTVAETISRNDNVREFTESVSIAETFTQNTVTPPWQWEPNDGSQPVKTRWNNFEWA